jgi:glycosyltransferase involved in cell wall biosynthesis
MKKIIAFIGPLPPPVGGVALANIRVQNIVLEYNKDYKIINLNTSKNLDQADLYKRKGFNEIKHFTKNIFQLIKFVSKNKIDVSNVFVVPNISFIREMFFIFILKLTTKKLVIHLHAKTEGDYFLEGFKLKIFTKVISLGDVVFVLSEKFHKRFYAKYINSEKLIVLENFIDYKEFENHIEDKNGGFLYVGRLSEKKGFKTLVEAVVEASKKLKGLSIDVLGEFENDDFKQEVLNLLSKNNIQNFNFHGAKMGNEKFDYFKKNSVFIFPSYFENSPIVLKEAIAAKMAIISSDIIENKNILDPYNIKKYFKAKNNNDLAEQLVYLYENKKEVKTLMYNSQEIKEFDKAYAAEIINKHI